LSTGVKRALGFYLIAMGTGNTKAGSKMTGTMALE